MADTIKISLELADAAAQNALSKFISQGGKADSTFNKLKQTGNSTFSDIALSISKTSGVYDIFAGNLAANLVSKAFDAIAGSIQDVIREAAGSEQAIKNLNVALQNAGLFTPKASEEFQEFAGNIQAVTTYSDEAVLSSTSLLLSLTSLSKEGVKQATQAAVDLAATLNEDLGSATDKIVKAVNGNTTAFKKLGIDIQSADTDSARLTNTLNALSSQSGAAKATTETYAGSVEKLKNQQSELFEAVGKLITQSPAYVSGIANQASIYASLAKFISDNTQVIRDLGTAIGITTGIIVAGGAAYAIASAGLGILAVSAVTGVGAFGALGIAASAAWAAITAPITLVVAGVAATVAIVYQLVKNWDQVKISTYEAIAATIEFSAKTASLVSDKVSFKLFDQAKAYRDQANAIRENIKAAEEKKISDQTNETVSGEQALRNRKRLEDAQKDAQRHSEFLIETARINAEEISLIESQQAQASLDLLESANEQRLIFDDAYDIAQLEKIQAQGVARLQAKQLLDQQELEIQISKQLAQAKAETDDRKRREEIQKVYDKASIQRIQLLNKQELEEAKLNVDNLKKVDELREANQRSTFATIATLSSSNNQTLASIGKAAGITQIAIDTPVAISKALAAFPPPFNLVAAGVVGAAMAAQAAQIAGVKFADGGIVPGSSFSGDKVSAQLNSGELVLNRSQQNELYQIAKGNGGSGSDSISRSEFNSTIQAIMDRPLIISIDGREIIAVTRDQLSSGRTI